MALKKRIANVYLFPNGNLAVFDLAGQQIPELQGLYSIDKHKRILLEAHEICKYEGFEMIPTGWKETAILWADHFIKQNMSFEEIKEI
jgi:hypothetical protein